MKNYRNTLASNPYFSVPLKCNTVWSKAGRTQKNAENRNLKLNTLNNEDLNDFLKTFKMLVIELFPIP